MRSPRYCIGALLLAHGAWSLPAEQAPLQDSSRQTIVGAQDDSDGKRPLHGRFLQVTGMCVRRKA